MIFQRTPRTRFLFFLISDALLIITALYGSFFIRFDYHIPSQYLPYIPYYIAISALVLVPIFYFKGLYHFTWIYVSISNLVTIFTAVSYGFFFLGLLLFLTNGHILARNVPRSIILINFFLVFILVGGLRFSKRIYTELFGIYVRDRGKYHDKPKLLIIGAGDAGEQLIRSIKQTTDYPFSIAGIVDDSDLKQNTTIHNIKILGKINDLHSIQNTYHLHGIIIAIPSADSQEIKNIVHLAQGCGIAYIKIVPSLTHFMERRISIHDVRDINVEDLLGRPKITIPFSDIAALIKDKNILITGAAGSIGAELVKHVNTFEPRHLICLDSDETGIFNIEHLLKSAGTNGAYTCMVANILHKDKLNNIFLIHKPHIVLHAAAYKHVKLMEENPDEAVLTNILGTWNLAEAARNHNASRFILISTDKAVNPTSVMGMTKRAAEILTMHYNDDDTRYSAVRFGNVLGSRGSVVPLFQQQILSGGPVTITHPNMQRYFMTPSEATLLVLHAASLSAGKEIFVFDMGMPVKILALAEMMIQLAGFEPYKDIPIIFTNPDQGEKLFEEILTDKETMASTKNKLIYIAPNRADSDKKTFFEEIEKLIASAKRGDNNAIKRQLKSLTSKSPQPYSSFEDLPR